MNSSVTFPHDTENILRPTYESMKWEGKLKGCLVTGKVGFSGHGMKQAKLPAVKLHKRIFRRPERPRERAYWTSLYIK